MGFSGVYDAMVAETSAPSMNSALNAGRPLRYVLTVKEKKLSLQENWTLGCLHFAIEFVAYRFSLLTRIDIVASATRLRYASTRRPAQCGTA